jgi:hypothetical protein
MLGYIIAAIVILIALFFVTVAVVMLAMAVGLVLMGVGTAWIIWRLLPAGKRVRAHLSKTPVDHLTDRYVHGHIDISEFEQRVARVLAHRP